MNSRSIIFLFAIEMACAVTAVAEPPTQSLVVSNCRVSISRRASLAASRFGILRDISASEGDAVNEGDVIVCLRDDAARQSLAIAQKEMANNVDLRLQKKISELATLEYSKALELNRSIPGGFSELDLKKLRLAAEKSVLQIEQADFLLQMAALRKKEAEVTLESYRIVAPFSGVVLQLNKQPGESLSAGEVVVEIGNFDVMRVEGFIPVAYAERVERGAPVVVEVSDFDSPQTLKLEGRLKHVAQLVNEVSQEVRVWADVKNQNNILKDGVPAQMTIKVLKSKLTEASVGRVETKSTRPN